MIFEILILLALIIMTLQLWRVIVVLTLAVNNQLQQTTSLLHEIEQIRAGLFAITVSKSNEEKGWSEFQSLVSHIVSYYIHPQRLRERSDTGLTGRIRAEND